MANHILVTGFCIKWIYHLMPFFMLFTKIIIASTLNSDLSTFLALTYNWLTNKANIPLDAFFMFFMDTTITSTTNSNLSTFKALQYEKLWLKYDFLLVFYEIILFSQHHLFHYFWKNNASLYFLCAKIIYNKVSLGYVKKCLNLNLR